MAKGTDCRMVGVLASEMEFLTVVPTVARLDSLWGLTRVHEKVPGKEDSLDCSSEYATWWSS